MAGSPCPLARVLHNKTNLSFRRAVVYYKFVWEIIMELKIRKAKKEDENRIKELFIEMLQAIYPHQNVCGYKDGYLDKFFENRGDFICVAEANGSVIAYLSIEVHHESEDFIYLDDLSVSEQYRGNGIGTELIKTAQKFAEEIAMPAIVLHAEKTNTEAIKLYERLGYRMMEEENTRLRMVKKLR